MRSMEDSMRSMEDSDEEGTQVPPALFGPGVAKVGVPSSRACPGLAIKALHLLLAEVKGGPFGGRREAPKFLNGCM